MSSGSGIYEHTIELQSSTFVSDGMGGSSSTWATETRVRAAIWPTSVTEQIRAASPAMVGTHKIRIRYYDGIKASWRVLFGTRYFSIVAIVDKDEKHVQMDLLCREVLD
jgi:SPP1 family predicted phage head-tail adaptor